LHLDVIGLYLSGKDSTSNLSGMTQVSTHTHIWRKRPNIELEELKDGEILLL